MILLFLCFAPPAHGISGDTDNNGKLSTADAVKALQVCAGLLPAGVSSDADVNADGRIGTEEAVYVLQRLSSVPDSPVPETGQSLCYNNSEKITCPRANRNFFGQDANYHTSWISFVKLDSAGNTLPDDAAEWSMIRDNVTGLTWEVKTGDGSVRDSSNTYTWHDSDPQTNGGKEGTPGDGTDTEDFTKALNSVSFGGFSDWRLPTAKELSYIVSRGAYDPAVHTAYFPRTEPSAYWTSDTDANFPDDAWRVNFVNGSLFSTYKSEACHARAVRGGKSGIPETPVINGDGTVTYTEAGLMWQQERSETPITWEEALAYCRNLSLAGHEDWRLPNINELHWLADYTSKDLLAGFPGAVPSGYWSSTTDAHYPNNAWYADFSSGYVITSRKSDKYHVYAVREANAP